MPIDRRTTLRAVGAAATGGLVAVAGCPSGGGGAGAETETGTGTAQPAFVDPEPNYQGWFDGVSNYEGTLDRRDTDRIRVQVGVSGDEGHFKFGPPAVAVSPDTSVIWEWTGQGGAHSVVSVDDEFNSGEPVRSDSVTFTATLQSPAIYRYFCDPHRDRGMRGAVYVALD